MSDWTSLGPVTDFPLGKPQGRVVDSTRLALFHTDEGFYALEDCCSHAEVRLSDGWQDGACVACPWHGAQFELATGKALSGPAILPVQTYPVRVVDGQLEVQLSPEDHA